MMGGTRGRGFFVLLNMENELGWASLSPIGEGANFLLTKRDGVINSSRKEKKGLFVLLSSNRGF